MTCSAGSAQLGLPLLGPLLGLQPLVRRLFLPEFDGLLLPHRRQERARFGELLFLIGGRELLRVAVNAELAVLTEEDEPDPVLALLVADVRRSGKLEAFAFFRLGAGD